MKKEITLKILFAIKDIINYNIYKRYIEFSKGKGFENAKKCRLYGL